MNEMTKLENAHYAEQFERIRVALGMERAAIMDIANAAIAHIPHPVSPTLTAPIPITEC